MGMVDQQMLKKLPPTISRKPPPANAVVVGMLCIKLRINNVYLCMIGAVPDTRNYISLLNAFHTLVTVRQ